MNSKYVNIGETPGKKQSKKVFIVPIKEYEPINPHEYFITTGEATTKIDVLIDDLTEQLKEMKKLKKLLIKTKGESDYLETCWEDGNLVVKKKEKRSRR